MKLPQRVVCVIACLVLLTLAGFGSAYNGQPRLIVVIIIDQFRGDYLERYRDQFKEGGFRTFLDRGAYFTNCNYDYASTQTAPGHATLLTGAYANGHGIRANEWWSPAKKKMVTSVYDDTTKIVGLADGAAGASPRNLLADTLGDQLKLSTQGRSRVFAIGLKDRSAVLPAGYAGDAAYWIDPASGAWITSTYYMNEAPKWVQAFNSGDHAAKYWGQEWKGADGKVLRKTSKEDKGGFYGVVGATPFANDYEFEFARELVANEKLGSGPATDLLVISLSANDILGHQVGPDSPEMQSMVVTTDRQIAEFFGFLGRQVGLLNIWAVLSADHGIAPVPAVATKLRIPAGNISPEKMKADLNTILSAKLGRKADYVREVEWPSVYLADEAFGGTKMNEADAERAAGEALKQAGERGYFTKSQMAEGAVTNDELGRKYLHSYSPYGGWYVMAVPTPFFVAGRRGTSHETPYTYDTHVPLAFFGLAFRAGTYRTHCEPADLAETLSSLLGIDAPTHSIGRVLTEALAAPEGR